MTNFLSISIRVAGLVLLTLLAACDESNEDRISELSSLRIVAVRSDLPFASPSSHVKLEMLVNDASPEAGSKDKTPRKSRLLWLGSCVNPEGDLYYNCFPQLRETLRNVSDEELNAAVDTPATVEAKLGFGKDYQLAVPSDIISGRPQAPQVTYPYGVVVLFYTACAGELRIKHEVVKGNGYPIECYDPITKEALSQADFEFGFYPIYVYENLKNQVPKVKQATFDAQANGRICTNEANCKSTETCGSAGTCIPRIASCPKDEDCKRYKFKLVVDKSNQEPAASAHVSRATATPETLWVSYYADFGKYEQDARIICDSASGCTDEYFGEWSPKVTGETPALPREAHLYAVVRDSRGGVTWVTKDVYVE